jgi:predicted aconitase with swiveling domain
MKSYQVGDTTYQFPDEYTDDQATAVLQKTGVIGAPKDYAPPVPRPALPPGLTGPVQGQEESIGGGANEPGLPSVVVSGLRQLGRAIPAFANSPMRGASDVMEGTGKIAAPLAIPALISNPVTAGIGLLGGAAGSAAGSEAATQMGADPETARFVGNLGGLAGGGLSGAAAESPKVRGFVSGAAAALPTAVQRGTIPAAVAYGLRNTSAAPYADAVAAAIASPPVIAGGRTGAAGKDWAGPMTQSVIDMFSKPQPPRTAVWQGAPAPGQAAIPDIASIPATQTLTGRRVGGIQNQQPLPAVTGPSSAFLDQITESLTNGKVTSFNSGKLTSQQRETIQWIANGTPRTVGQPGGLLATQPQPAEAPASGLLGNPQMPTPPQVRTVQSQAAVPVDPNAELRARLQKGGTPDSVQNAINKVNAIGDYLKSDAFQQWDAKPDLKDISKADLQRVYDQAYQYAVKNNNPTRPQKGYKNPDPAGGTWQEILKNAGLI